MTPPVRIWLDDLRPPPDDSWDWVRTVENAIELMQRGGVDDASLDHDLGRAEDGSLLPEGRTLAVWMAEHDCWPSRSIAVHSANAVGVDYMVGVIERYSPFEREGRTTRFVRPSGPA